MVTKSVAVFVDCCCVAFVASVLGVTGLTGCATNRPTTTRAAQEVSPVAAQEKTAMGKPFLFREADLPKGFPLPASVGEIVIKDYPPYRLARVRSGQNGVEGGPNKMFRPLFNHIKRNEIAMTAPVELGYGGDTPAPNDTRVTPGDQRLAESMAFLYRDPTWGKPGSDEADPRIVVEDVPAMTVLSIGVRGSYTDDRFAAALKKLQEWITANPERVRVVGPPRYLAYNSPFVPGFLRFGEVQLPVTRAEGTTSAPHSH